MFQFLIFITIVRVLIAGYLELAPDEAYYWNWSRHLDWSYYDHPPMVAWLIHASTFIGNHSELWVRFPAILLSLGLSVTLYIWAGVIFPNNRGIGWRAVLWVNIILIFAVGSVVITPDTPLVFFFTLTLYWLYKAIFENNSKFWYFSGFAFGLALLSKYTALLMVPCLVLFLFFSNSSRFWLRRKELYLFFFMALLIFGPVLLWNFANDWASFKFQLRHGFSNTQVNPLKSFLEFLGAQVLITTPIVFVGLAASIGFCYYLWD